MDVSGKLKDAATQGWISDSAKTQVEKWLTEDLYSAFRDEIVRKIDAGAWEDLNDCFYQIIPFGTGGRRGQVGVGPNRMNAVTVAQSAQGLANKLFQSIVGRRPRVAVAYDTRMTSPEFSHKTACVLAGNGVEVLLFEGPRSTPQLSFTVRDQACDAGVVISASHNPPEDNGFKAYWSDGGQVVPPLDGELIREVEAAQTIREISFPQACAQELIRRLGADADDRFREAVLRQSLIQSRDLKIVYSPLHGTGITSVWPVLQRAGFKDLHLVESQKDFDGRFPNVPGHKPNPEVTTGLNAAIELAQAIRADVAMVSDPDADRLGCAVPDEDGNFVILSGNQCAALMMEFIASEMKRQGTLKPTHRVYTTVVSSPLFPTIARAYGLKAKDDLLVGFKWIAEQIARLDDPDEFLFGSEESIGFMKGPQTRDKDASVAALVFAELAARSKAGNKSVLASLDEIYRRYGYFCDKGTSIFLEGAKGSDRMKRIMAALRENPPKEIGGYAVAVVVDRQVNRVKTVEGKEIGTVDGPPSNLLIFRLREDNKSFIAIRPSGTEPKIKFYFSLFSEAQGNLSDVKERLNREIERLAEAMTRLAMNVN